MPALLISLFCVGFLASINAFAADAYLVRRPLVEAVVRSEGGFSHLSLSPSRKLLAFTDSKGLGLSVLDLASHEIFEITKQRTGPAFFWSPDAVRLFFREIYREKVGIKSELAAFDTSINRRVDLEKLAGSSGFPVLNPRNHNLYLMHEKGILQRRLEFPGERPARWQVPSKDSSQPNDGHWIASQSAILWLGTLGLEMKKLNDDGSGINSFSISPDGNRIAWASKAGRVYVAFRGGDAVLIDEGQDPSWHPERALLVYAAARKIGNRVYDYDIKISDLKKQSRSLSVTADLHERWPIWLDPHTLLFTADGTTDLFRLSFKEPTPIAGKSSAAGKL